ncbi:MAG: hypothetical protein JWQ49_1763 [Edaphobacter sp.]|nr:hypothetical protein [Edaphobacter sp.]
MIDADEVMEGVGAVQEENLKGLDDDVDILTYAMADEFEADLRQLKTEYKL